MFSTRQVLKLILIPLFIIFFSSSVFAQPPNCTINVNVTPNSGNQPSRVIYNNQVLCINGPGTYKGSITVNSGGHLVICGGNITLLGSVAIMPGGKYWRTPTSRVIGSFVNYGATSNNPTNCSGGSVPEINLQGGGLCITDGDTSPGIADDTDFGAVVTASGTKTNTFTIQNTGTGSLSITGAITSSDAQFTITQPSTTSIPAGSSETFDVTFDPSTAGFHTATLNIPNDDSNENPYNFNVIGEGSGPPAPIASIQAGSFLNPNIWDCNCAPQPFDNIIINNNITIENDFDQLTGTSFTINNGNTVTVQTGNKLSIAGDLINNGSIFGDVSLNGTSLQTPILGVTENLEINNNAGVTLGANLDISGYLKLTDGVLNTDGYNLTLKSTAGQTALAIDIAGSVNGDLTVERFVPIAPQGHHFLSSPVSSASIGELSDDIAISLVGTYPTLYFYDETIQSDHSIDGWTAPTSLSHPMAAGTGITAYFDASNGVTIDITGDINSGTICVPLNSTPPIIPYVGNCPPDGWNLIGNPYPSPIDFNQLMALSSTSSDVENTLYIWDPTSSTYFSYINGVSSPANFGGIIPSMQAFWVRTSSFSNLCFEDAIRITDPNAATNDFYKSNTQNESLLRLEINGQGLTSEAVFRFNEGATDNFDNKFDARVLQDIQDATIELASQTSDGLLKINGLPELESDPVTIPLMTEIKTAGGYEISLVQFDNFGTKDKVYLEDHVLNVVHELNVPYSFSSFVNGAASRFSLRVVPDESTSIEAIQAAKLKMFKCQADVLCIDMQSVNTQDQVLNIYNAVGQNIQSVQLEAGQQMYQISLLNLKQHDIYMMELSNSKTVFKIAW